MNAVAAFEVCGEENKKNKKPGKFIQHINRGRFCVTGCRSLKLTIGLRTRSRRVFLKLLLSLNHVDPENCRNLDRSKRSRA